MSQRPLGIRHPLRHQRGAGALIVVMVLFFVISLVAAYSNRNIIFEQKTSANQYRSTQAFEAAEAGIEWTVAMLNSGNVDDNCLPSAAGTSFRNRYLNINSSTGAITNRQWPNAATGPNAYNVWCVRTGAGWSCSCPTLAVPNLVAPAATAPAPAFQVTFLSTGNGVGYVTVQSQGCTSLNAGCFTLPPSVSGGDAEATITAVLALKGAVSTPPAAALTAGPSAAGAPGAVNAGGAAMQVTNAEPLVNGVTVDASGAVNQAGMVLVTVPGSPAANSVVAGDVALPATADFLFASVFGMARSTYQQQPAAIVLTCAVDDCGANNLSSLAASNPGRILWLVGDVSLGNAVSIGSPGAPTAMVVNGNLTATAAASINGLVYVVPSAGTGTWTTGGSPVVNGAVVVEGSVDGAGTPNIAYNLPILNTLRVSSGSFVRVPGGWLDN